MIIMDRKKAVNQILGPAESEKPKEDEGGDSSLHTCIKEFIDAVKADDVDAAVSAFRACYADLESEEDQEEGE